VSCSFRPKLDAFAARTLLDEDRRAVLSHLPSCPACREEAARLESLRALLGHLDPYEPQDAEWQRIDRAVLSAMGSALDEQREPASMGWLDSWLPAFSMAGAAAAVLLVTLSTLTSASVPAAEPGPSAPPSGALAVALGDDVHVIEPSGSARVLSGGAVDEGDQIEVAEAPLTLQTDPATGVRAAPHSRLGLDRLALGHTAFRLDAGELAAEVKPLLPGSTFQVRAADLLVSVRGTAFKVIRHGQATRIEVAHGLVSVEREGGGAILVPAPGSVEIADGAPLVAEIVRRQVSPDTLAAFPLDLPDRPLAELALLPPRRVDPPSLATLEPAAPVPAAAAAAAALALAVPAPHPRASQAKAAALREAFGACLREPSRRSLLNGCYDDTLKRDLNFTGQLTLTVSVDPSGAVRSVETSRASRGFLTCAQQVIRRCEQPGTGEDVQLELPLELSH
jgi:hypothetical protein